MRLFEFCLSDENIYIVALDFLYSLSSHFFPSPNMDGPVDFSFGDRIQHL